MLTVETMRKIRVASSKGKSIRRISRELNVSRNTIRKVLRGGMTEFECESRRQPAAAI
jgi:DNA-binding NarL/FixJ family response regulator